MRYGSVTYRGRAGLGMLQGLCFHLQSELGWQCWSCPEPLGRDLGVTDGSSSWGRNSAPERVGKGATPVCVLSLTSPLCPCLNRTQNCTGGSLPPPKIGHLNSKLFLNEIAKKEKQLRKLLEGG